LHIPGKENLGADMMIFYPKNEDDEGGKNITINKLLLHEYSKALKNQFERLSELQYKDTKINRIMSVVSKYLTISKWLLFSINHNNKYRLMIHETMKTQLIQETYVFGTCRNLQGLSSFKIRISYDEYV